MIRVIAALGVLAVAALSGCSAAGARDTLLDTGTLVINSPADRSTVRQASINVKGDGPPGAEIVQDISFAPDQRTVADADGHWEISVDLDEGDNELTFRIGSDRGTEVTLVVVYDPEPIGIIIDSPRDRSTVHEAAIKVKGDGPPGAEIVQDIAFAPDQRTVVDADGHWEIPVDLDEGDNELTFRIGSDRETAVVLRVTYNPAPRSSVPLNAPSPRRSGAPTPSHSQSVFGDEPTGPVEIATVISVTDGDTIRVLLDGDDVPVRYIGIDTPETQTSLEWMGPEATAANSALVAGQQVVLEKDVSETDQYGRLLRYVWLERNDGWLFVNLELLRQGFASVMTYPPDVKYADALFLPAQQDARDAGLGLWGAAPTPPPTPAPAVIQPLVPQPTNCEPSYPGICIPVGSPDLDCGEIQWRRFAVVWNVPNPDPHGFDGDGDGIGCES